MNRETHASLDDDVLTAAPLVDAPQGPIPQPLRLLYLMPAEAFGGAERQGVGHIQSLLRLGIDVTAVVGPGIEIVKALEASGVRQFVHFKDFPSAGSARPPWARTIGDWMQWAKAAGRCRRGLLEIARCGQFDVVFANRPIAWPIAGMIAANFQIPYVIRSGGRPANPLTRIPLAVLRIAYPPPALFVANCEAVRATLAQWFDCPSRILANGVDLSRYHPLDAEFSRKKLGLPGDRPIVGMAARPAPEKGIGFLVRVARICLESKPDILFVVAGDHVTRAHYQARIERLGLSQSIWFLGHVEDMASFYASCDVVVLTSPDRSIEGSPNALLEAMAMSRAVVATRVGGIPELVRDGIDGYLDDPTDVDGFASHLLRLLAQPWTRRHMGESGRRRATSTYDAEQVALQLAGIVRTCAVTPVTSAMGVADRKRQ